VPRRAAVAAEELEVEAAVGAAAPRRQRWVEATAWLLTMRTCWRRLRAWVRWRHAWVQPAVVTQSAGLGQRVVVTEERWRQRRRRQRLPCPTKPAVARAGRAVSGIQTRMHGRRC